MSSNPVIHLVVVGFHHKKGYQIEFCYPAWRDGVCPVQWRHLSSLCMPDGAHNFSRDMVYFHLPPLNDSEGTVFGISSYRQIDASLVVNKSDNITRTTVQKSVVVLTRLPLYGYIQVKLDLITDAYFATGDFSRVELLCQGYDNLNSCLSADMLHSPRVYIGLCVRDLVLLFQHRLLLLFKLLLLERRVLLVHSSAGELSSALLTLVSLLPALLQRDGLRHAAAQPSPPLSPLSSQPQSPLTSQQQPSLQSLTPSVEHPALSSPLPAQPLPPPSVEQPPFDSLTPSVQHPPLSSPLPAQPHRPPTVEQPLPASPEPDASLPVLSTFPACRHATDGAVPAAGDSVPQLRPSALVESTDQLQLSDGDEDAGWDVLTALQHSLAVLSTAAARLDPQHCGMPARIFTQGYLCHPYLCLPDIHLLSEPSVRGFIAGATNAIYTRKSNLLDAYITMSPVSLQLLDDALHRQLALSTEDLRFAEMLVRAASQAPTVAAGRGSDLWLRNQLQLYLYMLLRTSLQPESSVENCAYNSEYMCAVRGTHWYRQWRGTDSVHRAGIMEVNPGHPCTGQLSFTDMKLRIAHTIHNVEKVRRVTMAAAATGRVVGGALQAARGTLTNWWSSISTDTSQQ